MAGITQEVHPYQPNVTKSCLLQSFSRAHFLTKMHGSFYVFPMKGSVRRICKNIFKKVSQKNRNFRLKIGYNSGCNIKYTWLLKVEYLLNGSTDLYETLVYEIVTDYHINFRKDPCTHTRTKRLNVRARVYAPNVRARARSFTKFFLVVSNYLMNFSLKFRKDPCFR